MLTRSNILSLQEHQELLEQLLKFRKRNYNIYAFLWVENIISKYLSAYYLVFPNKSKEVNQTYQHGCKSRDNIGSECHPL